MRGSRSCGSVVYWQYWPDPKQSAMPTLLRPTLRCPVTIPATEQNDNGASELDSVLNYWTNTGVGGDKLAAYASIEAGERWTSTCRHCSNRLIYSDAPTSVSKDLPASAQVDRTFTGRAMGPLNRPNNQPGSWGGHAIIVVSGAPDASGKQQFQVVTWGGLMPVTTAFIGSVLR